MSHLETWKHLGHKNRECANVLTRSFPQPTGAASMETVVVDGKALSSICSMMARPENWGEVGVELVIGER